MVPQPELTECWDLPCPATSDLAFFFSGKPPEKDQGGIMDWTLSGRLYGPYMPVDKLSSA